MSRYKLRQALRRRKNAVLSKSLIKSRSMNLLFKFTGRSFKFLRVRKIFRLRRRLLFVLKNFLRRTRLYRVFPKLRRKK